MTKSAVIARFAIIIVSKKRVLQKPCVAILKNAEFSKPYFKAFVVKFANFFYKFFHTFFTNFLNFFSKFGKIQLKKTIIHKSILKFKFFALCENLTNFKM